MKYSEIRAPSSPSLDAELMKTLGSVKVQIASLRTEVSGMKTLVEHHEKQDLERFNLLQAGIISIQNTLAPKVEKLAIADAETTARVAALSEENATRKTLSIAAKARQHQWVYGIIMAVVGAGLALLIKFIAS